LVNKRITQLFTYTKNNCSADTTVPQALESAAGGWGLFASVTVYIVYAILKDLHIHIENSDCTTSIDNPQNVEPQADEQQLVSTGQGTHQEQNVKFVDTHPGYCLEEKSTFDNIRDHALESDASLDEFFHRPIKIKTYDWDVGGVDLHDTFNPWSLYFENPRVINRLSNYKLMRSKLHIKATISGNGFHYGRVLLTYNPFPKHDNLTVDRTFVEPDFVAASQRPHIYLDPTNSQGGELVLPFFYHKNVLDITQNDWQEMGELTLADLQGLKHANGAADTVTINIFAWAEDAKFAIPTHAEPSTLVPQADEYDGPVSRVAGVVATAAGKLTSIPKIAPFARATEIGAGGLAAVAHHFGYSRPIELEHSQFRMNTKSGLAVTNMRDDTVKLTVDHKQELSIDPRTAGLDDIDELGINYLASKESYFTQFPWAVGTPDETLLYNVVVDPGIYRTFGSEFHMPACSFASLPFKFWRGSMKFRFQIVCSKYHKGRLKFVYDPSGTAATSEYNTAYTTIVDIADTTDFEMTCGWGQPTSYNQKLPLFGTLESSMTNTVKLPYTPHTFGFGNGTLAVYVVNELTVPMTTIDNDISINVFISMGDDFEVAVPEAERLQRVRFTNINNLVQPQAEEVDRMDSKPHHVGSLNTMGATTTLSDQTNHIHFGESIRSFRQLLKRYTLHEVSPLTGTNGSAMHYTFRRHILPFEPGYTAGNSNLTTILNAGTSNDNYAFGFMTLPRYLTSAYGGWKGGMRYMWDFSNVGSTTHNPNGRVIVTVDNDDGGTVTPENLTTVVDDTTSIAGKSTLITLHSSVQGFDGMGMQALNVNPTICFETPYYSDHR
ncbi:structural polyprotein, partial [Marine RNA virus BC-1]